MLFLWAQVQDQCSSVSSLMTQTVGWSAASARLQMTQSCSTADTMEGQAAIHREQDKLEKWAHFRKLMKSNRSGCMVLHLGQGNPRHKQRVGKELDSSPEEDLEVPVHEMLDISQQCALTA